MGRGHQWNEGRGEGAGITVGPATDAGRAQRGLPHSQLWTTQSSLASRVGGRSVVPFFPCSSVFFQDSPSILPSSFLLPSGSLKVRCHIGYPSIICTVSCNSPANCYIFLHLSNQSTEPPRLRVSRPRTYAISDSMGTLPQLHFGRVSSRPLPKPDLSWSHQ